MKGSNEITMEEYEDTYRKLDLGEEPGPLPTIERATCQICSSCIKDFCDHLERVSSITITEHEGIFKKLDLEEESRFPSID